MLNSARLVLAAAIGLIAYPCLAQEMPEHVWSRVEGPDPRFSIETPCDLAELEDRTTKNTTGFVCNRNGLTYGVAASTDGLGFKNEGPLFDSMLAAAKAEDGLLNFEALDVRNGRAVRISRIRDAALTFVQINELDPDKVAMLIVFENPRNADQRSDGERLEEFALRFFNSLEIAQ